MPVSIYPVRSFAYGKLDERFLGRTDSAFYGQGCIDIRNMFPLSIGAAERRPGTIYSATTKTAGKKVVLIPWLLSDDDGLVLEFGHNYIRYYHNHVQVAATETATTYTEAELPDVRVVQIATIMYIVHHSHKVAKLTRTNDTTWGLADVTFTAGAGEQDFSTSTNYPSHIEFYEDRLILARTDSQPGTFWGSRVSSYEDFSLLHSATVTTPVASPGIVTWTAHALKANDTVTFDGGTLPTGLVAGVVYYVVGASITANTFQVSATGGGAAINFTGANTPPHTGYNSPPNATNAWQKTPQAKAFNNIRWIVAEDALLFGTSSGPFRVGGKEELLTPDKAWWPRRQAAQGSAAVQALMVDDFAVFVGKGGKGVYRFQFDVDIDKYIPENLLELAGADLAGTGIIGMAHQRYPKTILWAWTADGALLSGVYSRATQTLGWAPHDFTGTVESACVIPTADEDELWLSVARTVGGSTIRHVEYIAAHNWSLIENYHGVDAAVVVDNGAAKAVTSITNANPAVCSSTGHGFSNTDLVRFSDVAGLDAVNGEVYMVKNKTADTFELWTVNGAAAIDFSAEATGGTGGTVEKVSNVVTGLTHLEGLTVSTLGDGSVLPTEVVSGEPVTLDEYANKIRTGLKFKSILDPMDIAEAQNRKKSVLAIFGRFYKSVFCRVGPDDDPAHLVDLSFPGVQEQMDIAPAPFTGGERILFKGYAGYRGKVHIELEDPLPLTVQALIYEVQVGT